ncbi:glycosyltransferase family 2 protein [Micromonospora sp. CPCC 206060]|uniref:glycosyltransferase family 2 protein n=1 Tax=Micromonospora sp. CPCC 206060 TaxID=3122406 RepID=UPI002FEFFBC0
MNTVSLITAVHPPSVPYLLDAYESLDAQELPEGWNWQWVVQEDGTAEAARSALPDDPRISYGCNRAGGPAVVRTTALMRATGGLIRNFDADDKLLPGALARDISHLVSDPSIGFTVSRCLDLLPDGGIKSWAHLDPAEGRLAQGAIMAQWQNNDWQLSVHPTTTCIRRELLLAVGGWMAMTTAEDTGMLLAANALADGWFIWEPSILYRKHEAQVTAQRYHTEPIERQARRDLIVARVNALASFLTPTSAA